MPTEMTFTTTGEKSTNRTPTAALRGAMLTTIGVSLLVAATLLWAAISNTQAALAVA